MFLTSRVSNKHIIEIEGRIVASTGKSALQLGLQASCKIELLSSKMPILNLPLKHISWNCTLLFLRLDQLFIGGQFVNNGARVILYRSPKLTDLHTINSSSFSPLWVYVKTVSFLVRGSFDHRATIGTILVEFHLMKLHIRYQRMDPLVSDKKTFKTFPYMTM